MTIGQRIAILGDFHMDPTDASLTVAAMEDIKNQNPELVIPLGDFGSGETIGTPEGITTAWEHIAKIGAPIRPILGNHDLQGETVGKLKPGTMEETICGLAKLEASFGIKEYENYRMLFITTEYQPEETCWQVQECYVSDRQFNALCSALAKRPGVPVIVLSHAPPIGSRLKTHPKTHPRSTNAYLEQNHQPHRWLELYRDTPEIVLWFSAHYHIGHDHPDSHTEQFGTHFFHTQVHGECTRDGARQTRLLEISHDHVAISTIDHVKRQKRADPDWQFNGGLQALMAAKKSWNAPEGQGFLPTAIDNSAILQVLPIPGKPAALVYTEECYLWEIDLPSGGLMGAHHFGCALDAIAISANYVWRAWGCSLAVSDLSSLTRFTRLPRANPSDRIGWTFPEPIKALLASRNGRILALTRGALWEVDISHGEPRQLFQSDTHELEGVSRVEGGYLIHTKLGMVLYGVERFEAAPAP